MHFRRFCTLGGHGNVQTDRAGRFSSGFACVPIRFGPPVTSGSAKSVFPIRSDRFLTSGRTRGRRADHRAGQRTVRRANQRGRRRPPGASDSRQQEGAAGRQTHRPSTKGGFLPARPDCAGSFLAAPSPAASVRSSRRLVRTRHRAFRPHRAFGRSSRVPAPTPAWRRAPGTPRGSRPRAC